jgi:hypothetical protein
MMKRVVIALIGIVAMPLMYMFTVTALLLLAIAVSATAQGSFNANVLISVRTSNDSYLIDSSFNILKTWHGASPPAAFAYMLPDGSILRPCGDTSATWGSGGAGGRLQRIDANDNVVWDYLFSDNIRLQHHDVEPMPNGNVLVIAWERKFTSEVRAAGRTSVPGGEMWPTMIAELEPVGATGANIVWEWHLWDHLIQDADPAKDNYGVIADHPELVDINHGNIGPSWDHANAIDYNPQLDQILFSARSMNEIYIIDHSTTTAEAAGHTGGDRGKGGDILYRWGNPQVYDRGDAADQYYFGVHGANWIDPGLPGAGNILTFNNGNRLGTANDYSSVEEIRPPMALEGDYIIQPGQPYGPAAPEWAYQNAPNFYSVNKAGAFRLPNGNTLITEANDNLIFEVTRAGSSVWAYPTPGEVHRAPAYWTTASSVDEPQLFRALSYPNPSSGQATIEFELATSGRVTLEVFDIGGRRVATLVNEDLMAGPHYATWLGERQSGRRASSGVYFYRLTGPGFVLSSKFVITK